MSSASGTHDFSCATPCMPQDIVTANLPRGGQHNRKLSVLEIAAGRGRNIPHYLQCGYAVTAVEYDDGRVKVCFPNELITAPAPRTALEAQGVVVCNEDIHRFEPGAGSFDVIVAVNVLQLVDADFLARKVHLWLKNYGRLILRVQTRSIPVGGEEAIVLSDLEPMFTVDRVRKLFSSFIERQCQERWVYVSFEACVFKPRVVSVIDFVGDQT